MDLNTTYLHREYKILKHLNLYIYFWPIAPVFKCMGYALTQSVQIYFSSMFGYNYADIFALHIISLMCFYVYFS